jgi:hypothetical protein
MLKDRAGPSCLPNSSASTEMNSTIYMSHGTSNAATGNKSHNEGEGTDSTANTAKSTGTTKPTATNVSADYVPNKEFDVIFYSVEGLAIENHLCNFVDKIGGSDIRYAPRLSGGRVCVYLAAESLVKELS